MGDLTMTTEHIPTDRLFEKARLKTALSTDDQSHLTSCEACRKELSWMEVAADMDIIEPPQSVMDKVLDAGRNTSRLKQLRNAITALLTFDSLSLAPVGVRSESASRQMTFEADGVEVGLWLRPLPENKLTISGQVSGKSSGPVQDTSAHVDLVVDGDHVKSTPLSSWGEFVFHDLPNGPCGLQIHFRDRVVNIPLLR
jgi:hypothetical protein